MVSMGIGVIPDCRIIPGQLARRPITVADVHPEKFSYRCIDKHIALNILMPRQRALDCLGTWREFWKYLLTTASDRDILESDLPNKVYQFKLVIPALYPIMNGETKCIATES